MRIKGIIVAAAVAFCEQIMLPSVLHFLPGARMAVKFIDQAHNLVSWGRHF
jgi:hypothetical protein